MTSAPMTRLAQLVTEAKPGFACGEEAEDGILQIRMNNITRDGRFDLSKRRLVPWERAGKDGFLLRTGDILFNTTNSPDMVGKTALVTSTSEPTVFSNHFLRIRTNPLTLTPAYLTRWLQMQFEHGTFKSMCRQWVNQATVNRDALLQLAIPLPPIERQQRITEMLDRVDELRSKRRQAIACIDSLLDSVFSRFLADIEHSEPPRQPLGSVVERVTVGHVGPTSEFFCEQGVPFIRTGDIGASEIIKSDLRHITPEFHNRLIKSSLRKGDVLVSRHFSDEVRCAIVPPELDGSNCSNVIIIRPGKLMSSVFLSYLIRSPRSQHAFLQRQVGSAQTVVNTQVLQAWPVPVPPLEVQMELAIRIAAAEGLRAAQRKSLAKLDALFASLQDRAFRGLL